jgi:hypothetical protein
MPRVKHTPPSYGHVFKTVALIAGLSTVVVACAIVLVRAIKTPIAVGDRAAARPAEQIADDRRFWRFNPGVGGGYFRLLPSGQWEEIAGTDKPGALQGVWEELGRTPEYVELYDRQRDYKTRLGAGKAWLAYGRDGAYGPSPHGDWERPNAVTAGAPRPAARPADDERNLWRYAAPDGQGFFRRKPDGIWEEWDRGRVKFRWAETARTADYVELYDAARKYTARLDAGKMLLRGGKPTDTLEFFHRGTWEPGGGPVVAGRTRLPAPPNGQAVEGGVRVYQTVLRSAVWVISDRGAGIAIGSGALIDSGRQLILTNYHVVGDADRVVVLFPAFRGGELVAEREFYLDNAGVLGIRGSVQARDRQADLALVRIDRVPDGARALALAPAGVAPGQSVHSIGNPAGSGALWVYTPGKVRQVYQKRWGARAGWDVLHFEARVVETDSPTNPGDSGGPLANDRGELVGVTQGGAVEASLLSTFIDVSEVRRFLNTSGAR